MIKSFRGKIGNGGQHTITVHTNNGRIGYQIVKLEIMTADPFDSGTDTEHIMLVWKVARTATELGNSTTTDPDFADSELLAASLALLDVTGSGHALEQSTIFDNQIFNQDIYITQRDVGGSTLDCNYYIELEQKILNENETTVATLKDIRSNVVTQ